MSQNRKILPASPPQARPQHRTDADADAARRRERAYGVPVLLAGGCRACGGAASGLVVRAPGPGRGGPARGVRVRRDLVTGRLQKYEREVIERTLTTMGRLTLCARQLDMLMDSDALVDDFVAAFLAEDWEPFT